MYLNLYFYVLNTWSHSNDEKFVRSRSLIFTLTLVSLSSMRQCYPPIYIDIVLSMKFDTYIRKNRGMSLYFFSIIAAYVGVSAPIYFFITHPVPWRICSISSLDTINQSNQGVAKLRRRILIRICPGILPFMRFLAW